MKKFIIMNPNDNCATALNDINEVESISVNDQLLVINQKIPLGHKFALTDIKKGEKLYKYGEIIGIATQDIKKGDWVHTHNITSAYLEAVKK